MQKLLLVYNANSGTLNTFFDIGHKLLNPKTYSCNLCTLTHNTFSENKIWKEFRTKTDIKMTFYHIDEFKKEYPNSTFDFPSILIQKNNKLNEFIPASEINKIKNVKELIEKIKIASELILQ